MTVNDGQKYGPSSCRDCQARIVWALTETDKRMPVDLDVVIGGTLELYFELLNGEHVGPQRVRYVPDSERATRPFLWISHFATCPARQQRAGKR